MWPSLFHRSPVSLNHHFKPLKIPPTLNTGISTFHKSLLETNCKWLPSKVVKLKNNVQISFNFFTFLFKQAAFTILSVVLIISPFKKQLKSTITKPLNTILIYCLILSLQAEPDCMQCALLSGDCVLKFNTQVNL